MGQQTLDNNAPTNSWQQWPNKLLATKVQQSLDNNAQQTQSYYSIITQHYHSYKAEDIRVKSGRKPK